MGSVRPQLKSKHLPSRILSCLVHCWSWGSSIHMQTRKPEIFSLVSTLQPISKFCPSSPLYATSATTQFRPFLSLCLDNWKLVFLVFSLIPLTHSSRGHQHYLSKHLFVSYQPLASKVRWLPISCRSEVQISWPGLKSPSPSGCRLSCLFWLFLCYTPHAHTSTQVHILHMGTGMIHMPQSRRDTPIHTLLCSDCT